MLNKKSLQLPLISCDVEPSFRGLVPLKSAAWNLYNQTQDCSNLLSAGCSSSSTGLLLFTCIVGKSGMGHWVAVASDVFWGIPRTLQQFVWGSLMRRKMADQFPSKTVCPPLPMFACLYWSAICVCPRLQTFGLCLRQRLTCHWSSSVVPN